MSDAAAAAHRRIHRHTRAVRAASTASTAGASHTTPIAPVPTAASSSSRPELVPVVDGGGLLDTPWARAHLAWMARKDALAQDMFLIGAHTPLRRQLAFRFCELNGRACEYVALTADTSEADLKARRELRATDGGGSGSLSVVWVDQAVVRAAVEGRVLVLEGLEKAERNVLPVLNNLLENREMQLEDGRFLVAPKRFDALVIQGKLGAAGAAANARLVRVSPDFRVIAVGVPAPPFPGNPLDPPLRSRFQARYIDRVPTSALLMALRTVHAPTVPADKMARLLALYEAIWALGDQQGTASGAEQRNMAYSALCYPCEHSIVSAARLLEHVPTVTVDDALSRIFPAQPGSGLLEGEAAELVQTVLAQGGHRIADGTIIAEADAVAPALVGTESVSLNADNTTVSSGRDIMLRFALASNLGNEPLMVPALGGPFPARMPDPRVLLPHQYRALSGMLQSAAVGRDVCLIGGRGEGKTFVARWFAAAMGYVRVESLFLFEDMTARDLFNRRSTNARGESVWLPTPLTNALRLGRLCLLDGLHRLPAGTISALVRLLQDREVTLNDGTRFISPKRWHHLVEVRGIPEDELRARNVAVVHPSFRVLGLAVPRDCRSRRWLSNEVMQLFHFFVLPGLSSEILLTPHVGRAVPHCPSSIVESLVRVRSLLLAAAVDPGSPLWVGGSDSGSTRREKKEEDNGDNSDGSED